MPRALPRDFFERSAVKVAPDLLGKVLVQVGEDGRVVLPITEVEAYEGTRDRASHASRGETARNRPMFGPSRHWYVYLVYGMHWMLNVVTGPAGHPGAVLLRGAGAVSGPGRLTKHLGVDGALTALPMTRGAGLWIEDRGIRVPRRAVERTPRIGVDYAGDFWAGRPWRFSATPGSFVLPRGRSPLAGGGGAANLS